MQNIKLLLRAVLILQLFSSALHAQLKMTPTRVGVLTQDPQFTVDVRGDLFVRSNFGGLMLGYPDNGNQWRMGTVNAGQDMLFRSKPEGSSDFSTRMIFFGNGDAAFGGDPGSSNARMEVLHNSSISDPHILLTEQQNDYGRLSFENITYPGKRWTIAGYPGTNPENSRLNLWFEDTDGGKDIVTVRGNGHVGIMGINPTARLHIHQQDQEVGSGLRFDDGINADWDITHGFGLRLHYGGALRGTFSATTGEYIQSSDSKLKKNIQKMPDILSKVMELRPLNYQYKDTKSQDLTIGFVAQEVDPLFPELVHFIEADQLYGINYAGFSVVAIKAIQELKSEIDRRDERINELEDRLDRIETLLRQGQTAQNHLILEEAAADLDRSELKQNTPNPFKSVTTITYLVPERAQRVQLRIADQSGKVLRTLEVEQRGRVQTNLDATALPAGTYFYSLWVDGQLIGTKKMVLSR
ncbi:tail fiber domain-containing protein [Flavilitoribacter nigricans]|uniref:Peptidase S74 domain-containing protein n=1 Tax=Flavilitoribacter nigricans (strain ATCC 23147 / DSM 23189 / NBRC 102662 / NCIMB 1420 / SS-2) TaxID=1122177 RepID=A0A2D0NE68_FLAN2|nr:tail fiber domain-containing protein [Flavilitoribacter nigricans]PHN06666.1 hypothetical protein CRP01_10240 [Flavilitoribacter nigricans DSM 23189 = NBRC 102662]